MTRKQAKQQDRVLTADETPIYWRLDERGKDALLRIAERFDSPRGKRFLAYERGLLTRERNRIAKQQQFRLFSDMEEL